jgi:hypothetical protein
MNCPHCKSATEMVFSVLCHGFICQEADCGFEMAMDSEDLVKVLDIQPVEAEPELIYA